MLFNDSKDLSQIQRPDSKNTSNTSPNRIDEVSKQQTRQFTQITNPLIKSQQKRNASEGPKEEEKVQRSSDGVKKRHSMHLTPDVIMPSPNGAIKEETVEEDKDDDIVKIQS